MAEKFPRPGPTHDTATELKVEVAELKRRMHLAETAQAVKPSPSNIELDVRLGAAEDEIKDKNRAWRTWLGPIVAVIGIAISNSKGCLDYVKQAYVDKTDGRLEGKIDKTSEDVRACHSGLVETRTLLNEAIKEATELRTKVEQLQRGRQR